MTVTFKNLKLYYFDNVNNSSICGRGEHIRLLLKDSDIDFEYVRINLVGKEWTDLKQKLISEKKASSPTLPFITIDGKYYGKAIPIMRYISNKLGKYIAANDEDAQLVDSYADIVMGWVDRWANAYFWNPNEETIQKYESVQINQAYDDFENILVTNGGPYLLGNTITYPDFALFHMIEDDGTAAARSSTHPHVAAFIKEMQNRPNLKAYLKTDRN
ncbi:glutathione S-transferase [Parasitella parasitica]|nr:glutathione S-transferase [Parasitella parasitica]